MALYGGGECSSCFRVGGVCMDRRSGQASAIYGETAAKEKNNWL